MKFVLSSTAMLKHGAACRSANNWSRLSSPMSSIRLIIIESDVCNHFILCKNCVLVVQVRTTFSAEAKMESFTVSESEDVFVFFFFFARAEIHTISKDASVERSAAEVVL